MHHSFQPRLSSDRVFSAIFARFLEQFCCETIDGCVLCAAVRLQSSVNFHGLLLAEYEVPCNVLPRLACHCSIIVMPRGTGAKTRSTFTHVKSRQHKARGLKPLEDVVSRELGAPYTVQPLRETGHIVLTAVAGRGGLWRAPYGTNPLGQDRGTSVAHPVTPSIEDRGAVPHPSSSARCALGGLMGHKVAACTGHCGGLCCHDGWCRLPVTKAVATPI